MSDRNAISQQAITLEWARLVTRYKSCYLAHEQRRILLRLLELTGDGHGPVDA